MSKRGKSRGKPKGKFDDEKNSLAFKVLSADNTKELLDLADVDHVQRKLGEILSLTECATDLKCGASLDFYVGGFWWCKQQSFDLKMTSAVFTVMQQMVENVRDKRLSLPDCLVDFKSLFAGVGVDNPDISGGLGCLDIHQGKQVMDYFYSSFFQHYKMYEFMFHSTQAEEIIGTDITVEVPQPADLPWPPPLAEGVPLELYNSYICTPPPTPSKQQDEEGQPDGAEEGGQLTEEQEAENDRMADLLAQLSTEEVKGIMNSTLEEMLGGIKGEVEAKLRQKEYDFLNRINKVHRTPSASTKS